MVCAQLTHTKNTSNDCDDRDNNNNNFVSQAREISIFGEDCKLAAPLFSGALGLAFVPICDVILSWFRFEVFFELGFHSDCIRQRENAVLMKTGVSFFGWAKTNYIIAKHVYTTRFTCDRLFISRF